MKNKIIELGKKYELQLYIKSIRKAFDIIDYEIYNQDKFIGTYRYYTGKTSTGVTYPTKCFLSELESDIKVEIKG